MTNTIPQDDSNLDITVTEADDLVTIQIQPASFTGTGGGGAVDSVNGLTGVVVLDTDDIDQGTTNLYYADSLVDSHLTGGTGVTYTLGTIGIGQDVGTTADVTFGSVTSDMFGVQHFTAKARETISAGQPVYISGHSGNTPEVMVADFDDPAKMPAFGIASADIANNNNGAISTYGDLKNVDTTGSTEGETWAVGDVLYVNAGKLTNTRPTGETEQVQVVAKIIRVHQNTGQLFLLGAGRVNDIPNLTSQHVFVGNGSGYDTRQLDYSDLTGTPAIPADQTLSFANPNLSISNGNSVDLSALTPTSLAWSAITSTPTTIAGYGITDAFSGDYDDLTNKPSLTDLQDVTTIAPDTGGLTITNAGQTEFQFGSDAKLKWRSQNDGGAVDQWVFDNTGNNIFTGMQWRTSSNRKIFRFDAEAPGGTDPGDGSHTTKFVLSGSDNTFFSKNHNETAAPLTFNSTSLQLDTTTGVSIGGAYTLPTSDGGPDQVIATDGNGGLTFVDQSGGGGSIALDDLTDVAITGVSDGDLLRYNGTATEWQNTNLGLTLTPIVTMGTEFPPGAQATATITNYLVDYDDANIFAQVKDSGGTVVITNTQLTKDLVAGTVTFTTPATEATGYTLEVKVQDFGDLESDTSTSTFEVAAISFNQTFRYWRIADWSGFSDPSKRVMVGTFRLYSSPAGAGTSYPPNMTANNAPTPYVALASRLFASTYDYYKAFDSNQNGTFWWNLGDTPTQGENSWIQIDLGTSQQIQSVQISHGQQGYSFTGCKLYGSDTGAFAGEETEVADMTGLLSPWSSTDSFIIG